MVPLRKPIEEKAQMNKLVREIVKLQIQNLKLREEYKERRHSRFQNIGSFRPLANSIILRQGNRGKPQEAQGAVPTIYINSIYANVRPLFYYYCYGKIGPIGYIQRERCSQFQFNLLKGMIYIDNNRKIYLGPPYQGASPFWF